MLNVANLRKSSLWLNADLICSESLFSPCNRPPRLLRKREKFGEDAATTTTRVQQMFATADKFPCSSTKTNRNLSVAAFLKTNPGSLGHLAVGEVRRCRGGDWHRPLAHFPPLGKSLEQSVGLRWWPAVWRDPAGGCRGTARRAQQCRALGITTSRCPSPGRGGPVALGQPINVTFK